MVRRNHILIAIILLNITFGYGQVQLEPACAESTQVYGVTGYSDSEFIWSFDPGRGTVIEGNGTDTIVINWGYSTGLVTLEVLEVTNKNCSNFPQVATFNIRAPYVDLGEEFPERCEGDSLILDAGEYHEPEFSFLWHDGSTESYYVGRETEVIWVRVIDGYGCTRYDTVSLVVHSLPVMTLGWDTLLCDPGSSYELYPYRPGDAGRSPLSFSSYTWTTSGTDWSEDNPWTNDWEYIVYPNNTDVPDSIALVVEDENSCRAYDTIANFPCNFVALFADMSNTITPNNDGVNDVWNISPNMVFFDEAVLEIFDRWGRLVYRTTNVYEEPWDGTSKGKDLPMDSYYFVLDLKKAGAKPIVGTINLVR